MHVGDTFPNLVGETQDSTTFDLYRYVNNSWSVIFIHPGDFTPVCTTELASAAELAIDFKNRGVKLVGFSCNDANSHRQWIRDIEYLSGNLIDFPIFCDPKRSYSVKLGLLDQANIGQDKLPLTVRGTFILRPDQTIASMMIYPHIIGRNLEELLRLLDALLLQHDNSKIATPANWKKGEDVLVDVAVSDDDAKNEFGIDGFRIVDVPSEQNQTAIQHHYMRYTEAPRRRLPKVKPKQNNDKDGCCVS